MERSLQTPSPFSLAIPIFVGACVTTGAGGKGGGRQRCLRECVCDHDDDGDDDDGDDDDGGDDDDDTTMHHIPPAGAGAGAGAQGRVVIIIL